MDNKTEYRIYEGMKRSMSRDLMAGQRDFIKKMNSPDFVNRRSQGTFHVLTEGEIAERRGEY